MPGTRKISLIRWFGLRRSPSALTAVLIAWVVAYPAGARADWDCRSDPASNGWICTAADTSRQPGPAANPDASLPATGAPAPTVPSATPQEIEAPPASTPAAPTEAPVDGSSTPQREPQSTPAREQRSLPIAATTPDGDTPTAQGAPKVAPAASAEQRDTTSMQNAPPAGDPTTSAEGAAPAEIAPAEAAPTAATPTSAKAAPPGPEPADAQNASSDVLSDQDDGRFAAVGAPAPWDIDAGLDWSQCGMLGGPAAFRADSAQPAPGERSIDAEADSAEFEEASNRAILQGRVQLDDGIQTLRADRLVYERGKDLVTATGRVLLSRPEGRLAGALATLDLSTDQGRIESAEYRVPAINARGTADAAQVSGDRVSRYENITFTTCRPGQDDWYLTANALELDHAEGLGTATGAKLRLFDVPLAYLPQLTFPIDDRRRSGVLLPAVGYSDSSGFEVAVPYYLNLAPNYDATLIPHLMSRRGLGLGTEFRFLSAHYRGELDGNILPYDAAFENGATRGYFDLRTRADWTTLFEGRVNFNYVSDSKYFEDFGNSLAETSARQVERVGELRYYEDTWDLLGRLQYYQNLDRDIATEDLPYSRLPQVLFNYDRPALIASLSGQMRAEYANFWRKDSLTGQRVDLKPGLSLPLRRPWGYLEPSLQGRYTAYRLENAEREALSDDTPDRLLGIASLDAGLYFERRAHWFGGPSRQTLEPRLFYLYVPSVNQDDLPVFDTTEVDLSFDSLFRENRFTGADRQGDANQVALALISRVLDDRSGAERLRAALGQVYFFSDRTVTLPGEPETSDDRSAVSAEVAAQFTQAWKARAGIIWDPNDDRVDQALAQVSYLDADRRAYNAGYRFRDQVVDETNLAFLWPVSDQTRLIGRWNYSLLNDRTLEAVAGVEYGRCCWRIRALLRQFTNGPGDDYNLAFWLQLELNGLGQVGTDVDEFLERGVYGYRTDDY